MMVARLFGLQKFLVTALGCVAVAAALSMLPTTCVRWIR